MNPVSFDLPTDIKTFFENITFNTTSGDYMDSRDLKKSRFDGDFFKLAGDDGNPILCHKCGYSALKGPIIGCDFCPLYWHMDCLDPPMTAPLPGRKAWQCPAHCEDMIPKKRKVAENNHSVMLNDPFVKNDGDVEIILDPSFPEEPFDRNRRIRYQLPEQAIKLAFFKKAVNEIEHVSILVLRQLKESESYTIDFATSKEFLFLACRAIVHTFIFNAPHVLVLLILMRFLLEDCYDRFDVIPIDTGT
jgi:hypothetical protein